MEALMKFGSLLPRLAKLVAGSATALVLAACVGGAVQETTPIQVDQGRAAAMVSEFRAANGLGPVGVDSRLSQAAGTQAVAMGRRDTLSHRVGGSLARRVSAVGYDWGATAENIGAGYSSLDDVMAGWRASAGHRKNLLNPNVTEIGIAAVATPPGAAKRSYWALVLAGPRPKTAGAAILPF